MQKYTHVCHWGVAFKLALIHFNANAWERGYIQASALYSCDSWLRNLLFIVRLHVQYISISSVESLRSEKILLFTVELTSPHCWGSNWWWGKRSFTGSSVTACRGYSRRSRLWDQCWRCLLIFVYALAMYACLKYTIVQRFNGILSSFYMSFVFICIMYVYMYVCMYVYNV